MKVPLREAAARLGVTADNLRAAIKRGTFTATKVGTRGWFAEEDEIRRYDLENRRR